MLAARPTNLLALVLLSFGSPAAAQAPDQREFFETEVRPLLADNCWRCHGVGKQQSGLRLDHGSFVLQGGSRGPAVVPGDADASLLLHATSYLDVDLQMPPPGRLPEAGRAVLRRWIEQGAWWPEEPVPVADATAGFDLTARRASHWAWQPIRDPAPPRLRGADRDAWSNDPIDRFVKARLDAAGLPAAPPADRRTWLRRVTFDLTGLPPTTDDITAFLADHRPGAEERVVDRLLASTAYAERQTRHFQDLVRYAETRGHEFDFAIHGAWRYRDYLVRAFDQDVRYDQLIVEHLAGDLLDEPRLDPASGAAESPLGTASLWFMDQSHSPVESRQARADRIDNAIDVVSKAFLGVTVACARCHDHKFDAISTRDYYALSGILRSSRFLPQSTAPEPLVRATHQQVDDTRDELLVALRAAWSESLQGDAMAGLLAAAADLPPPPAPAADEEQRKQQAAERKALLADRARGAGVTADTLQRVAAVLRDAAVKDPRHPLHLLALATRDGSDPATLTRLWSRTEPRNAPPPPPAEDASATVLLDAAHELPDGWQTHGPGLEQGRDVVLLQARDDGAPRGHTFAGPWLHSAGRARRSWATLTSPDLHLDRRYLHVYAAGRSARLNVVLNGFHLIRAPIYGALKVFLDSEQPRWYRIDTAMWQGDDAWLEFADRSAADPSDPFRGGGYGPDGWFAVQRVVFSDDPQPPTSDGSDGDAVRHLDQLGRTPPADLDALCQRYQDSVRRALQAEPRDGDQTLLDALWQLEALPTGAASPATASRLEAAVIAWRAAIATLPDPAFAPGTTDGPGVDEHVHLRGSWKNLGEVVPRHFLSALGGQPLADPHGSGRLEYARRIIAADNPLTARVAVNRYWHHLFGRGLVATVDNFGVLGEEPSHPELLDHLATWFRADGWSVKRLLRRLVLTRTYRSQSRLHPVADRDDPDVILLHRARVRRLQGEALRDAMLQIAGRLDPTPFGPGIATHLTPFLDGRGRPGRSGPLDGAGRRSVYLEVRRNFLNPFFQAFDSPMPFSTVGRRTVSNVPAQALSLLNDPLVHELAADWAATLAAEPDPERRIERMYSEALGRLPSLRERTTLLRFVTDHAARLEVSPQDQAVWTAACHALWNVKEFAFLR